MIRSAETTKILVGLLFILVVGPSTFLGGAANTEPVLAKDSEPNSRDSRERHADADAIQQTYRSLRSNAIQSELGITETARDNDNGTTSPPNDSTSEGGVDNVTIQQSSPVGSFTVKWDLVTTTFSIHLQYSGQIEYLPLQQFWRATASGSCVHTVYGTAAPPSQLPDGSIGYNSNSGTIQFFIIPDVPFGNLQTSCTWPPSSSSPSINFPATIQNGMAISSDSIVRPCLEDGNIICSDTVSWDISVPLPPEVCPQDASSSTLSASADPPPTGTALTLPVAAPSTNAVSCPVIRADAGEDKEYEYYFVDNDHPFGDFRPITLDGSKSTPPGQLTYKWEQVPTPEAPTVDLNDKDTVKATFKAPKICKDTTLRFKLTVSTVSGGTDSDTVDIKVKPPSKQTLIHIAMNRIGTTSFPNESDPVGVIDVNKKITKAYANLYLDNKNFKWAGMAAFASNSVGKGMVESSGAFCRTFSNICPEIFRTLAAGNFGVYNELGWQHEAYRIGGICLIEYHKNALSNDIVNPSLGNQLLLNSWQLIDQGIKSGNPNLVWQGNRNMLEYEQTQFLQHTVYDPSRAAWKILSESTIPLFKPELESPVPLDGRNFREYIFQHRPFFNCFTNTCTDIGNVVQRWGDGDKINGWILGSMLPHWQRLESTRPGLVLVEISKLPN